MTCGNRSTTSRIGALARFADDRRGGVALVFALVLPALVGFVGVAVDYASWSSQASRLQSAADAAALAAAQELSISAADERRVTAVAQAVVRTSNLADVDPIGVVATLVENRSGVRVSLSQPGRIMLSGIVRITPVEISVSATAVVTGTRKLCVLGLDPSKSNTINLDGDAKVVASGCAVISNSRDPKGVAVKSGASITAQLICSAGGFEGSSMNYAGIRMSDCPTIGDPLAHRPAPPAEACTSTTKLVIESSRVLRPGTYCEGIEIKGTNTRVDLQPGIYVIKDGELKVDDHATLYGRDVGFYFTGNNAKFDFLSSATVDLGAPRDGRMAGILFFGERGAPDDREFKITSDNARTLLGTIYLPRGFLTVDASNPVADRSAYTAIVTRRLDLKKAPYLVLNANYAATDVPVPEGIARAGPIHLSR